MFFLGASIAGNIRIGNALGAGDTHRAKVACWLTLFLGLFLAALTTSFLIFYRNRLPYLFTTDEDLVKKLKCRGVPVTDLEVKPWRFDSNAKKEEDVSNWKRVQNKIKKQLKKGQKKLIGLLLNTVKRQVHRWHDVRMTLKDHAEELYIGNSEKLQAQKEVNMPLINRNCILTDCKVLEDAKENEVHKFELTFQNVVADTKDEAGSSESSFTVRSKFLFACAGTKSVVRSILPKEPDVLLSEDKSVWRGMAPNIDVKGKATFYRGVATDDTAGRSALIFPGGRNAGSSLVML